jgi:hypothetical protein
MPKTQKEIFLTRLMHERDKFELLLNRVGYARRMTLKGVSGKWSIKDILAHVMAYEQYIADRLNEILHGETYVPCRTQNALDAFLDEFGYPDFGSPLLDDDGPNAWVTERYQSVALEDVIAQELQAFTSIVASLEKIPDELMIRHHLYDRVANNTFHHYREHTADIKRWLRSNAAYNEH